MHKRPSNPQVSETLGAGTRAVLEAMIKTQKKRMRLRGRSQLSVLFWEGAKCFRPPQHPAGTPPPYHHTALHLSAIQWDTGSCRDTLLSQDGCRVMSSLAASEQIFTDVGGGDRLKEDATVSMRASFISKIQFIHVCLSASSHCNVYIHGGTSHPFPPFISSHSLPATCPLLGSALNHLHRLSQPLGLS